MQRQALHPASDVGEASVVHRIQPTAQAKGLAISCHLFCEVSAQLLAATPTAHWLEYADWWNPVLAHPLEIRDGMAIASERAGSGIDWK